MQVIRRTFHRLDSSGRALYTAVLKRVTYRVYAPLIVIVAVVIAWELVSHSVASAIDDQTLGWNPGWILVLWMGIGLATGAVVHVVFWSLLVPYRHRLQERRSRQADGAPLGEVDARHSHEIAPHFFAVVGVIYAVLVAFVVVTAWQVRARAEDLMIQEQHSVDYLFHLNEAVNSSRARHLQFLLRDYAVYTLAEWGQMQRGERICRDISESDIACFGSEGAVSKRANFLAHCITMLTVSLPTAQSHERMDFAAQQRNNALYTQSLRVLQVILESRAERRLRYNERTLQPILWTAFLLGALLLAGMTYFVLGQSFGGQCLRTCALFGMVGMMSAIAVVFDRPFAGTTHVEGSEWGQMVTHFNRDLSYASSAHLLDNCEESGESPFDSDL